MKKFLKQFKLTPMLRFELEQFLFRVADRTISNYGGACWDCTKIGSIYIASYGKPDTVVTANAAHSSVNCPLLTACAAVSSIASNHFWHRNVRRLTQEQNNAFMTFHNAFRNSAFDDNSGLDHSALFTLTD